MEHGRPFEMIEKVYNMQAGYANVLPDAFAKTDLMHSVIPLSASYWAACVRHVLHYSQQWFSLLTDCSNASN